MSQAGRFTTGSSPLPPVVTITGNSGGPVPTDGGGNINIVGTAPMDVTGNPGTNTLTITVDSATTISEGVVELATDAETIAGVDATRAVTPSSLAAKLGPQTNFGVILGATTINALDATAAGSNGQLLIGATASNPAFASLTSSGGTITITPGPNTLNIDTVGGSGGLTWNVETGASANMAVNNGYIADNAGTVVLTLPAVAAVGDIIRVTGINNATGWEIAQNAGQTIHFGTMSTTTGVAGTLTSTAIRDSVELVCVVANDDWNVLSSIGNISVV